MNEKKYFIDDRVIIPDDIRNMTKEELQLEISRLEAEAATAKRKPPYLKAVFFCPITNKNSVLHSCKALFLCPKADLRRKTATANL